MTVDDLEAILRQAESVPWINLDTVEGSLRAVGYVAEELGKSGLSDKDQAHLSLMLLSRRLGLPPETLEARFRAIKAKRGTHEPA
jgi:hypothetical protein